MPSHDAVEAVLAVSASPGSWLSGPQSDGLPLQGIVKPPCSHFTSGAAPANPIDPHRSFELIGCVRESRLLRNRTYIGYVLYV
jgi:hypothetical protein